MTSDPTQLRLVQLDQIVHLSALAIDVLVKVLRRALERGDDLADIDFLRMPGDPAIGCSEHLSRAPTLRGRFLQAKGAAKSRMLRADATKLTLVGTLSNSATGSPDSLARLPHIALPCSDCPPHRGPSHYMRRRPGSTFHTHLAFLMPAPIGGMNPCTALIYLG